MNREEIINYAAKHGKQAAADLLLLIGPDGYTDNDFDDLMQELNA